MEDRSWMSKSRISQEYQNGVDVFVEFAFSHASMNGMILCPCKGCRNGLFVDRAKAFEHLIVKGFIPGYSQWIAHGELPRSGSPRYETQHDFCESSRPVDDMEGLVRNVFGIAPEDVHAQGANDFSRDEEIPTGQAGKFYKLIDAAQKKLHDGCETLTQLSFMVRLLSIKNAGRMSNKVFDMLLSLLGEAFPEAMDELPNSYYESEKLLRDLGLGYDKIDACPNDCIIYWKDNGERTSCPTCNEPRWRTSKKDPTGSKRKIAQKVLWHFPLKSRLQRLFMSPKIADSMRWHSEERTKDGYMRHPADSPAWETFDSINKDFAKDPRNVRLGLASDGFNPFSNMNVSHSTWPVILTPYNLPPWMCMKEPYLMLSLLIPGPSAPGNNMDVYLQPLIAELKELWTDGIRTYDASSKKHFNLYAALLWTISDFPGYANLSGWSTKGKLACPVCHKDTHSLRLKHGGKECYMGHRRFLKHDHPYRSNGQLFDGSVERRVPPRRLTGDMVMDELKNVSMKFGKLVNDNPELPFNWKKKSIFFELPYWKDNVIRHNLDFMHIEKIVSEKICGILLDSDSKKKDSLESRLDLQNMGIRPELHPTVESDGSTSFSAASFTMKPNEKRRFCEVLKNVKVPDGYSSNISRSVRVKPPKLIGLKSHDYHILMQQLLSIALRKTLPKSVRTPLLRLSKYFRELCSKVISYSDVLRLEKEITLILCELEVIFPPSFFDVMVHLTIHLATEVKLAGPVFYRWMYPIERYLGTLKSYVRNSRFAEGSIVKGYVAEECLSFCSLYLGDYVGSKLEKSTTDEDMSSNSNSVVLDIFTATGHPLGKGTPTKFDPETLKKAHQYALFNSEAVKPFFNFSQHLEMVKQAHPGVAPHRIASIHCESFSDWFAEYGESLQISEVDSMLRDLKLLSSRPNFIGVKYEKYDVNGFRFHVKDLESTRTTQNSGLKVKAATSSFSSTRDRNPILGNLDYYGYLNDIIELDYGGTRRIVLFDCDWVSKGSRLKQDVDGFLLANFKNVKRHKEPFILPSQAEQVFYVEDPTSAGWHVVVTTSPRAHYDMNSVADTETYLGGNLCNPKEKNVKDGEFRWVREGVERINVNLDQIIKMTVFECYWPGVVGVMVNPT